MPRPISRHHAPSHALTRNPSSAAEKAKPADYGPGSPVTEGSQSGSESGRSVGRRSSSRSALGEIPEALPARVSSLGNHSRSALPDLSREEKERLLKGASSSSRSSGSASGSERSFSGYLDSDTSSHTAPSSVPSSESVHTAEPSKAKPSRSAPFKGLSRALGKATKEIVREMNYQKPLRTAIKVAIYTAPYVQQESIPRPKTYSVGQFSYNSDGKGRVNLRALRYSAAAGRDVLKDFKNSTRLQSIIGSHKPEINEYGYEIKRDAKSALKSSRTKLGNFYHQAKTQFTSSKPSPDSNYRQHYSRSATSGSPLDSVSAANSVASGDSAQTASPSQNWSSVSEWVQNHAQPAVRFSGVRSEPILAPSFDSGSVRHFNIEDDRGTI
jgi:hypothetical protein